MSPGGGAAQVLQALASADCDRMSRELPCSAAHGPGLILLCTRHCGGNEHREKKFCTHARFGPVSVWWTPASTRWCLASVCVSSGGLFASGLFSFCSSIACRNAARCEMTVAGIRYACRFYTGHIHMEYASLLAFFPPDFKRTFYSLPTGIVEFQRADGMAGCFACPAVGQLRGWVE